MLNSEQLAFFKHNGYLIVKGGLDPQLCAEAQDLMWRELPKGSALDRYNPATHVGPFRPEDEDASAMHLRADYRWQQRQFGTEQLMIDLVFNSTLCGIYCTLPYGDRPRVPDFFTHV